MIRFTGITHDDYDASESQQICVVRIVDFYQECLSGAYHEEMNPTGTTPNTAERIAQVGWKGESTRYWAACMTMKEFGIVAEPFDIRAAPSPAVLLQSPEQLTEGGDSHEAE